MPSPALLHPDKAIALILGAILPPQAEILSLDDCLGRALLASLPNTLEQPPFDRATMDGYALALAVRPEPGRRFRVAGRAAAGSEPLPALGPEDCVRIMTGAALPLGATMVQRLERTAIVDEAEGGWMEITEAEDSANVNLRGANLGLGELLISPRRIGPQDLGVLASSGYARVEVGRRPVVGVLSTGDELRAAGEALGPSSIYDTNGPTLGALAIAAGAELRRYGIVKDDPRLLGEALEAGLAECDILLSSGGVSMGDYDYLPGLLVSLGVEEIFHKLAMKPGKPLWFGRRPAAPDRRQTLVFGLPGNPVSSFVGFELFIRPAIAAFQGLDPSARFIRARLGEGIERKDTERLEYRPARIEGTGRGEEGVSALPLRYTGSTMVQALAWADGLIRLEIGEARLEKGSFVDVRLLRS